MPTISRVSLSFLATLGLALAVAPTSQAQVLLWRLGVEDGQTASAVDGAAEWAQGTAHDFNATFIVPSLGFVDPAPALPAYQLPVDMDRDALPTVVPNDASEQLFIDFTLEESCDMVMLRYGRYGSETAQVRMGMGADDDPVVGPVRQEGTGEELHSVFEQRLDELVSPLPPAEYTLRIVYPRTGAGGGAFTQTGEDNGFYIDFLEVTAETCGD